MYKNVISTVREFVYGNDHKNFSEINTIYGRYAYISMLNVVYSLMSTYETPAIDNVCYLYFYDAERCLRNGFSAKIIIETIKRSYDI